MTACVQQPTRECELRCDVCDGWYLINCGHCGGYGWKDGEDCPHCDADGDVLCPHCNDPGDVEDYARDSKGAIW